MSSNDGNVRDNKVEPEKVDNDTKATTARTRQGPLTLQAWDDIVGQRIAQAMKDGEFENLPGKGKPQNLDNNPFAGDNQLAFDIMQNNDVSPGWVTRRKEVHQQIDNLRADMRTAVYKHRRDLTSAKSSIGTDSLDREMATGKINAAWAKKRQQWEEQILALNTLIRDLNLEQPLPTMELFTLRLDDELDQACVSTNE